MSANGESLKSNLETDKKKLVHAEEVRDLKSNSNNLKDSTKNGLQQNGSEKNGSAKNQKEEDLSTENIIEAFFCTVDKQRRELQIIEKSLSETIQKLEISLRGNLDASENLNKTLREQIEQGTILLREIKITLSHRESREKSMRLQLAKFHESTSLKDSEGEDGADNNLATTEPGSFTPQTITDSELDETSDEDHGGRRQMELNFVKTILKAAKIRQKMADTEDSNEKEESN